MASTINQIIKESIEALRKENLNLTPDNYSKYFCEVAKKRGFIVEDCRKIEKYSKKLNAHLQQDLKKLKVSTVDELLTFLIAKINNVNKNESEKIINSLVVMSKRILQATTLLHDKKARELANTTLSRLDFSQNSKTIDSIKDQWFDFITGYDDSFLNQLDIYGHIDKDDLKKMVKDIIKIIQKEDEGAIYDTIAPLIIASLTPSIASSMNDDLASISYKLRNDPTSLGTKATQDEIKYFIKKRIDIDKEEVKSKVSSLDELLDEINKRIFALIDSSENSNKQVVGIQKDLQDIDLKTDSFDTVRLKLVHIASSLEFETKSLRDKMKKNHKTIKVLQTRVKGLERALLIAKKEGKEDFLTHAATKRALDEELKRAEEAYLRYKTDYSLSFLDIDRFKMVNDTYGHEAGDVILANIGKILKKYVRQTDFVGRYGGEEFLVILPGIDIKQAFYFSDKIRTIIESYKFMYKGERIKITVSCGLSQRSLENSMQDAVEKADKMLYKAKESGRNRVLPDFS